MTKCHIASMDGHSLTVDLEEEGDRAGAAILVNGTLCHLERLPASDARLYRLDTDPDYEPHSDAEGFIYVVVPFSR